MPYIHRDANGEIASVHRAATLEATEYLESSAPELRRFLSRGESADDFAQLDADFVRVLEDLVDVLLDKGVLNVTDLPPAVQAKLVFRKDRREQRAFGSSRPVPTSGFVEVIDDSAFGQLGAWEPSKE